MRREGRRAPHAVTVGPVDELLLDPGAEIAVLGALPEAPRSQGGGSSRINLTRVGVPLDEMRTGAAGPIALAPGFTVDGAGDVGALRADAVEVARPAAILFPGLA